MLSLANILAFLVICMYLAYFHFNLVFYQLSSFLLLFQICTTWEEAPQLLIEYYHVTRLLEYKPTV